jgi:protein involved in polysaccharide export with SLBB domain
MPATFYVYGDTPRPGTYTIPESGGLTLSRAIVASGSTASLDRVSITRGPEDARTTIVAPECDLVIQAGDVIKLTRGGR